jgi:hypothetical protein
MRRIVHIKKVHSQKDKRRLKTWCRVSALIGPWLGRNCSVYGRKSDALWPEIRELRLAGRCRLLANTICGPRIHLALDRDGEKLDYGFEAGRQPGKLVCCKPKARHV